MDIRNLERNFEMLTLQRRAWLAASVGEAAVDQLIQTKADEIGERNKEISEGFAKIFDIAGFTEPSTNIRQTPLIAVSSVTDPERGQGALAVGLTAIMESDRLPYGCVDTTVFFRPEDSDDAELLNGAGGHYRSSIGSGSDVARRLREQSKMGKLNRTDPVFMFQEMWRGDIPGIEGAEVAIAELKRAIADPSLNPELQERVIAWEQGRLTQSS